MQGWAQGPGLSLGLLICRSLQNTPGWDIWLRTTQSWPQQEGQVTQMKPMRGVARGGEGPGQAYLYQGQTHAVCRCK